jgi:hypothetical protein
MVGVGGTTVVLPAAIANLFAHARATRSGIVATMIGTARVIVTGIAIACQTAMAGIAPETAIGTAEGRTMDARGTVRMMGMMTRAAGDDTKPAHALCRMNFPSIFTSLVPGFLVGIPASAFLSLPSLSS